MMWLNKSVGIINAILYQKGGNLQIVRKYTKERAN